MSMHDNFSTAESQGENSSREIESNLLPSLPELVTRRVLIPAGQTENSPTTDEILRDLREFEVRFGYILGQFFGQSSLLSDART